MVKKEKKRKKAHAISGYISRNVISKLIGKNSPTRPCPVQTHGLAQCLANRQHATNACHTNEKETTFSEGPWTEMVRDLETVLRREGWTNTECLTWKDQGDPQESSFQILKGISHLILLQRGKKTWAMVRRAVEIKLWALFDIKSNGSKLFLIDDVKAGVGWSSITLAAF